MKKALLCFCLLFVCTKPGAEENTLRFGLSLEANMNTYDKYTLGRSVSLDCQLFKYIVNGVILTVSDDFTLITVIEPEIFARWYYLNLGLKGGGFFVQGDLGMSLFLENTDSQVRGLGGLTAGFRYPMLEGDYFAEPYVRCGYPFIWGFGIRAGCRL
jgi:hypothetical protein